MVRLSGKNTGKVTILTSTPSGTNSQFINVFFVHGSVYTYWFDPVMTSSILMTLPLRRPLSAGSAMFSHLLMTLPWLVASLLETKIFLHITYPFRVTESGIIIIKMEDCLGQNLHSFICQLVINMIPVPGFNLVALLKIYQDGAVHIFHSLLPILVVT